MILKALYDYYHRSGDDVAPFGGYWWLAHFSRFCHLQIIDIQQYYETMYRDTNP